ncbi:MAG TPA: hypothetical protein VHV10_06005 [Ktedonobacteraceae bacterium]|nr:hypothetical protein [Ktedonobacteraceae bacterium]
MIEYNKAEISRFRGQISLSEEADLVKYINARFEHKIIQHENLPEERKRLLESANQDIKSAEKAIGKAKKEILDMEKEKRRIAHEKDITENIPERFKSIERKIMEKNNEIGDLRLSLGNAEVTYNAQEKLVAGLNEEMEEITPRITEIKDQQELVSAIQQAKVEIDREYKENQEKIGELREEQPELEEKLKKASRNRSDHAHRAEEIEGQLVPYRREREELDAQIEKLSAKVEQLTTQAAIRGKGIIKALDFSFEDWVSQEP